MSGSLVRLETVVAVAGLTRTVRNYCSGKEGREGE